MVKIEKNIPIMEKRGRPSSSGMWQTLYLTMEDGDSVLLDGVNQCASFRNAIMKLGGKYTSRKQADGKIRVWRTK